MNTPGADRQSPLGWTAAVKGTQPPRPSGTSRLQREGSDYPALPVGLKPGGESWNTMDVIANKLVAARVGVGDFVLGRPGQVLSRSA